MAVSKVTRVRSEGFSKIIANVRPTRGGSAWRRCSAISALSSRARAKSAFACSRVMSAAETNERPRSSFGLTAPTANAWPVGSALGVLGRLPRPLEPELLALLHARIAGQEPGLAERPPEVLRVDGQERAGDAVPDRTGLSVVAATLDLDHRVVAALGTRHAEGQADLVLI